MNLQYASVSSRAVAKDLKQMIGISKFFRWSKRRLRVLVV